MSACGGGVVVGAVVAVPAWWHGGVVFWIVFGKLFRMNIAAYYQDDDAVLPGLTNLLVCSIHFGVDSSHNVYIHLNDSPPDSPVNQQMFQRAKLSNTKIGLMVGGAGLAFQVMFANFDACYKLLANLLENLQFVSVIDLDIEEQVKLEDVVQLVECLKADFDIQVSVCCVASDLMMPYQPSVFSGFCYADLVHQIGSLVDVFNVQAYSDDTFSYAAVCQILSSQLVLPSKLCMGMISSQDVDQALDQLGVMCRAGIQLNGVFIWNMHSMAPDWPSRVRQAGMLFVQSDQSDQSDQSVQPVQPAHLV